MFNKLSYICNDSLASTLWLAARGFWEERKSASIRELIVIALFICLCLKDKLGLCSINLLIALLTNNTGIGPDSRTVIGRTGHVTCPIWSRNDWLTGPKIRIVGLSFAELEMDKIVHLQFYLPLSGKSKQQFQ